MVMLVYVTVPSLLLLSICVCQSVPLAVLEIKSGLSAGPLPSRVCNSLSLLIVDTSAPRGRALGGGIARSFGIKVPRPVDPSTPLCYLQSFLFSYFAPGVSDKALCFGFLFRSVL